MPKGNRWAIWRKWQIEYELMNRQDKKACELVNVESKSNLNNFWQMARIFCLTIEGKRDQSEFILDLIKSRGFNDEIFEELFQSIYNEVNFINIENQDIYFKGKKINKKISINFSDDNFVREKLKELIEHNPIDAFFAGVKLDRNKVPNSEDLDKASKLHTVIILN